MKRYLLPLLLVGVAWLPAYRAQAQDKPVLNTAPPGPPPAPPRPVEPTPPPPPAPQPEPTAIPQPGPAATPQPTSPPVPQPTPDSPSGLNFPRRDVPQTGSGTDQPAKKKFIYSNFGLGFGADGGVSQFNISAAPALGFRLTEKFAVGPGISYAYSNFSVSDQYQPLTAAGERSIATSSLGFKAFAQYIVYKEFFVHAEYEVTNAQLINQDITTGYFFKRTRNVTTPLVGLGYRSYFNENAAVDFVGLYNLGSRVNSLYPGLVLRFSFLFNIGR